MQKKNYSKPDVKRFHLIVIDRILNSSAQKVTAPGVDEDEDLNITY